MDPIGNIPLYLSFLKKVPEKRQKTVICRELLIALFIIVLFSFLGDALMKFLHIEHDTIQIAGGIILFIICLRMIFPPPHNETETLPHDAEPFIVPLAVPLVAGPSVLAAVMIYAKQESSFTMLGAILIAWLASLIILLGSSYLRKLLGWRGILAMERLMGLILILIAVQMFLSGLSCFTTRQVAICTTQQ
jgi:multiple antibiotic resistance protein